MTQLEKKIQSAEELVKRVLSENFGQKIDGEAARHVAEKISRTVPQVKEPKREVEAA